MQKFRRLWVGAVGVLSLFLVFAEPTVSADTGLVPETRPRVGLALSGGGARGVAHIGVLKVLEDLRVPIDYIAGTSMGSIVGGLYASGMSPEDIETVVRTLDWDGIFEDSPAREDRTFRRKRDDDLYLVGTKPGFRDGRLRLPTGAIQGQKFDLALNELTLPVSAISDFDRLPIPFRAVASDIATGESVVLDSGSLAQAIRASMAVPGVFAATRIDGRLLVDGGITDNMPIGVVRDMGADVIIAVDISTPYKAEEELTDLLAIAAQLTSIMTRKNAEAQLATMTDRDVLIVPELGDLSSSAFERAAEAVPIGVAAAQAQREALSRLSLPEEAYRRHVAARGPRPSTDPPVVAFVRVENESRVADALIRDRLTVREGEPLDIAQLEQDIGAVYGLELFESVRYEVVEDEGETGVVVSARERAWGPNYLQFGVALTADGDGESSFNIGLAYLKTALNPLGGELRVGGQLGEEPRFGVDLHQPLDSTSRFFVAPRFGVGRQFYGLFDDDGNRIATYQVDQWAGELGVGRELGTLGEARIAWRRGAGDVELDEGAQILPSGSFDSGSAYGWLWVDRLDSAYFPSRGYEGRLKYSFFREDFGNDSDYEQLEARGAYFHSFGNHTVGAAARYNTTYGGDAGVQDRFRLGGFLNLSGLDQNSITGNHSALLSATYHRRFPQLKLLPWYIGGSIEHGNVWEDRGDMSWNDAITSGSVFLGAETFVGPLYLGYGQAEGGRNAGFFFLGKTF